MNSILPLAHRLSLVFRRRHIEIWTEGGLGNQLFQANFAHYLVSTGLARRVTLVNMNTKADRDFAILDLLKQCPHVRVLTKSGPWRKCKLRIILAINSKTHSSKLTSKIFRCSTEVEFNPNQYRSMKSNRPRIIRGYFQKLTYFEYDRDCFDNQLRSWLLESKSLFSHETPFVFLHFRRGDFLFNRSHGPLSPQYFIDFLSDHEEMQKIPVYLSSDDINVINLFANDRLTFDISFLNCGAREILAWLLDSSCYIFLASNSTFSWWMAYVLELSANHRAEIYFPDHWFRDKKTSEVHILKPNWKQLPVKWS